MIQKIAYTLISIFIFSFTIHAQQESQEDLTKLDFKELKNGFIKNYKDSLQAVKYANAYFLKAKKIKDINLIVSGYYYRTLLDERYHTRFDLYDSIIALEKGMKNKQILSNVYYDKGRIHHNKFQYDKALKNYLKSLEYLKKW
ncbi:MAG: tetratricopeptide (TPR) repeat protein [Dokdonia sp.]|jgi:tetratricopeptide (TPR) repeat protein